MKCPRKSQDYIQGVRSFIQFTKNNDGGSTLFSRPCRRCLNGKGLHSPSWISLHLLKYGVFSLYTTWRYHGEGSVQAVQGDHLVSPATEGVEENVTAGMDESVTVGMDDSVGTSSCYKKKNQQLSAPKNRCILHILKESQRCMQR